MVLLKENDLPTEITSDKDKIMYICITYIESIGKDVIGGNIAKYTRRENSNIFIRNKKEI